MNTNQQPTAKEFKDSAKAMMEQPTCTIQRLAKLWQSYMDDEWWWAALSDADFSYMCSIPDLLLDIYNNRSMPQ